MKLFDIIKNLKGESGEESFDLKRSLKKALTTNVTAKLLCIFAALCLWFYVMGTEGTTFERTFKGVEVSFSKNVNGLQILSSDRVTVDVVLSGKRSVLNRMDASDINASVDISNISKTGTDTFAIKVSTSNDTSVESFSPRSVELHLDEPFSRTVSVETDYRGGTSDSELLTIGKITPSKRNVVISGPKDSVSKVAYAKAMVELNFISHSVYIENVPLDLYDEDGNRIDNHFIEIANGEDTVDVDVDVHMRKELPVVPVFLHGIYSDENISMKLVPEKVIVKGEISAVKDLTQIETDLIDEKELDGKSNKFKIGLSKPANVLFVGADEECSVDAYIKDFEQKTLYIPIGPEIIKNTPEGKTAQIHEDGIVVTICGISPLVSKVAPADFSLEIHGEVLNNGINSDIPVYIDFINEDTADLYISEHSYTVDIELK
ncbi:MAG: hypothetical protein E7621_02755 [Ruminococcaceae bacterium]|nr:hypothetical protein [Oscillospiraceae bacterium]